MWAFVNRDYCVCQKQCLFLPKLNRFFIGVMALEFTLRKNEIKSNKSYGKWYAQTVRGSELSLSEIAERVQSNCGVSRANVVAVITALQSVVSKGLKNGHVVNLGELGKFYLSIRSECVDSPDEFSVQKHVKGVVCKYIPEGHRLSSDGTLTRPFTENIELRQASEYDETGHVVKRIRRGGKVR